MYDPKEYPLFYIFCFLCAYVKKLRKREEKVKKGVDKGKEIVVSYTSARKKRARSLKTKQETSIQGIKQYRINKRKKREEA